MSQTADLFTPLNMERARSFVEPHHAALLACIHDAASWYDNFPPEDRLVLDKSTRASMINCKIRHLVTHKFDNQRPIAQIIRYRGLFMLCLNAGVLCRFKKLDSKGRSRNIRTNQQRMVSNVPGQQLTLPEMGQPVPVLIIGYQWNEMFGKISDVLVTYQVGKDVQWTYSITQAEVVQSLPAVPLPAIATNLPRRPVVTAKRTSKEAEKIEADATQ